MVDEKCKIIGNSPIRFLFQRTQILVPGEFTFLLFQGMYKCRNLVEFQMGVCLMKKRSCTIKISKWYNIVLQYILLQWRGKLVRGMSKFFEKFFNFVQNGKFFVKFQVKTTREVEKTHFWLFKGQISVFLLSYGIIWTKFVSNTYRHSDVSKE